MTPEQIQQNNELIARFMGLKIREEKWRAPHPTTVWLVDAYWTPAGQMEYHSSWDWLMPVVEKISTIKLDQYESCQDTHWPRTFGMPSTDGGVMVRFNCAPVFTKPTLIEAVHAAVCDFIKWYNEQNKQP